MPVNWAASPAVGSTTTADDLITRLGLPRCEWRFPDLSTASGEDFVGVGADLKPQTLIAAYAAGIFPMPMRRGKVAWFSPDPRGVLPLDGLIVSRSLRRSLRRYEIRIDTAFDEVVSRCATLPRPYGWISPEVGAAYRELHRLGVAHSVESWAGDELVGGLYGVGIGGFFAGESMFHTAVDASKVALVALVELLREQGTTLLDVQWSTPHLESLGVVTVARPDYLAELAVALRRPPADFNGRAGAGSGTG